MSKHCFQSMLPRIYDIHHWDARCHFHGLQQRQSFVPPRTAFALAKGQGEFNWFWTCTASTKCWEPTSCKPSHLPLLHEYPLSVENKTLAQNQLRRNTPQRMTSKTQTVPKVCQRPIDSCENNAFTSTLENEVLRPYILFLSAPEFGGILCRENWLHCNEGTQVIWTVHMYIAEAEFHLVAQRLRRFNSPMDLSHAHTRSRWPLEQWMPPQRGCQKHQRTRQTWRRTSHQLW